MNLIANRACIKIGFKNHFKNKLAILCLIQKNIKYKRTVMDHIEQYKIININQVFNDQFLNVKNLYLFLFNELPSMHFRNKLNGEKAFQAFMKNQRADNKTSVSLVPQKRNFLVKRGCHG